MPTRFKDRFKVGLIIDSDLDDEGGKRGALESFINITKAKQTQGIELNVLWTNDFLEPSRDFLAKYDVPIRVYLVEDRESVWIGRTFKDVIEVISSDEFDWIADRLIEDSEMIAAFHLYESYNLELSMIESMKRAHKYVVEPLNKFFGERYRTYDAKTAKSWREELQDNAEEVESKP